MQSFSQGREDAILQEYFKGQTGTLLSIGENTGIHLSNVRALILQEWRGCLVEPSPVAFKALSDLYRANPSIFLINAAIGAKNGIVDLWQSGSHINQDDTALLSTVNRKDYNKWKGTTEFKKVKVEMLDVKTMLKINPYSSFDFISLDTEGNEWIILQQLDLTALKCKCICLEHNSDKALKKEFKRYCGYHDLTNVLLDNAENVILSLIP